MPRLAGAGAALSRLGGGIGTRGPGETKLETDRRRLRHRIAALKRDDGRRRPQARASARPPAPPRGADRRAGRLHQRRQDHAVQRADGRARAGVGRLVRHARSAAAPRAAAGRAAAAPRRHGRLHRPAAAPSGRGVSRDARRGDGRRSPRPRDRRLRVRPRAARCRRRGRAPRSRRRATPVLDVYNKCDRLGDADLARLKAMHPAGVLRLGARPAPAAPSSCRFSRRGWPWTPSASGSSWTTRARPTGG